MRRRLLLGLVAALPFLLAACGVPATEATACGPGSTRTDLADGDGSPDGVRFDKSCWWRQGYVCGGDYAAAAGQWQAAGRPPRRW